MMPFQGSASVSGDATAALDATPDPTGTTIYFTAIDPVKGPGVFKVPADGSNTTPVVVQAGPPFAAPFGIATSTDGKQLYVADPGATDSTSNKDLGVIFSLPIGGGTPTILSGTELTEARGVEVRQENNVDVLYFTGRDKMNGKVGVFKIPATGGTITMVSEDVQLNDPSGIALDSTGKIYVADTIASASHTANIFTITGMTVTPFLSNLRVGYPCGLAITDDDKTLLVSALDPVKATDVLLQVDISSMTTMMDVPMAIKGNYEGAGIHRAKGTNVFAWADSSAGPAGGRVYTIK
jgi:DNA-binding beta-propeller fold protein YncE